MRRRHGALYDVLKAYFNQDPAEWQTATG
jgi:Mlc titration factor MtfA (ptsG expression regulator)